MADKNPSEAGYSAGKEGAKASDNPPSTGVIERALGGALAVSTGTLLDPIADADKAASEWEGGRQAGEQDVKDGK